MDIKKFISLNKKFIFKPNTIVSFVFLCLTTILIILYYDKKIGIYLSVLLLPLFICFYNTSKKNKFKMVYIYLMFSIITFIGEAVVIYKTNNKALLYNYTVPKLKVPSWLFLAYLNMVIFIWLLDDYFTNVLAKLC